MFFCLFFIVFTILSCKESRRNETLKSCSKETVEKDSIFNFLKQGDIVYLKPDSIKAYIDEVQETQRYTNQFLYSVSFYDKELTQHNRDVYSYELFLKK